MATSGQASATSAAGVPAAARPIVFLLGRGRTGTTWIGQILNRHPDCQYKYEPFNPGKEPEFDRWLRDLATGDRQELARRFDDLCGRCFHAVDYPPFLRKSCRPQSPLLLRAFWQLGKLVPATQGIYRWYGRPRLGPGSWTLIKQVNFPNERLQRLVEVVSPWIVAIIRNPFASVNSALRFYRGEAIRTPENIARNLELLPTLPPPGLRVTAAELAAMSDAAFEAVRWRVQSEPLAAFAAAYPAGIVIRYEDFADAPLETARAVYRFLGWSFDPSIASFIAATTAGRRPTLQSQERSQFSIHRDPQEAKKRWQKDLSPRQVEEIRQVVGESSLMELWPELAV